MCTIITIDSEFWTNNRVAVLSQITDDASWNNHGWSMLGLDPSDDSLNFRLSAMNVRQVNRAVSSFFKDAGPHARLWLHARYATTSSIGIGYVHGFDDQDGRIIFHNGVIRKSQGFSVDSFALTFADLTSGHALLKYLENDQENFANIFVIDTDSYKYSVVRLSTGSLYSDGQGNYSTNPIGPIKRPVKTFSALDHYLDLPDTPDLTDDWDTEYMLSNRFKY